MPYGSNTLNNANKFWKIILHTCQQHRHLLMPALSPHFSPLFSFLPLPSSQNEEREVSLLGLWGMQCPANFSLPFYRFHKIKGNLILILESHIHRELSDSYKGKFNPSMCIWWAIWGDIKNKWCGFKTESDKSIILPFLPWFFFYFLEQPKEKKFPRLPYIWE